jgi:tyrosine aminotransferase
VGLEYDKWKDIGDTFAFAQKLMDEENVLCLPGECFFTPGFVRIGKRPYSRSNVVISHPEDIIREACDRINTFCERHAK